MKRAQKGAEHIEKHHSEALVPAEVIENRILLIRGQKVILDKNLADLYYVETRDLNKAVNRNLDRFPVDFMFYLSKEEMENLKFHFGTSRWGGTRKPSLAFTEHGVLMLSSVLRSKRAVAVNIIIMRTFVRLRQMISKNKDLEHKLNELEHKVERHEGDIIGILNAIRMIMKEEDKPKYKIGFLRD